MRQQSWQPTQVTFGALASTAARDGNWLLVLELLTEMEKVQVQAGRQYGASTLVVKQVVYVAVAYCLSTRVTVLSKIT